MSYAVEATFFLVVGTLAAYLLVRLARALSSGRPRR